MRGKQVDTSSSMFMEGLSKQVILEIKILREGIPHIDI